MPSTHVRVRRRVGLVLLEVNPRCFNIYRSFSLSRSICQMLVTFSEVSFQRTVSRFKKRIREPFACVYVLHKMRNLGVSRCGRATTAKDVSLQKA